MPRHYNNTHSFHCPYQGCHMKCKSEANHRAKYAYMHSSWKKKVHNLAEEVEKTRNPEKSSRLNYDALKRLGILYPIKD